MGRGDTIGGKGKHKRGTTFIAAFVTLTVFVLTGLAGAERPVVIPIPNIALAFNSNFSPKALSKTTPTPIFFHFSGQVKTNDGTHPPALREFVLETDRSGAIDVKGLPVCRARPPEGDTGLIDDVCKDTIVGRGTMNVEVAFPESQPTSLKAPLTIFNRGMKHGVTMFLIHAFLKNPVSAAVVSTVKIRKIHKGRFGTKALISFPTIAGGSGSVTSFSATLNRRFSYKGKRASLLTLKCPDGAIKTRGEAIFGDDARASVEVVRPCTPKS